MLIIGLGNPGDQYVHTRHNLGFDVLNEYVKKLTDPRVSWEKEDKFTSEVINLGSNVYLLRPLTFMNNSGEAVAKFAHYFKISPEEIVVIHDDLDLPLGKIKVRQGGGAAGHHGVESIISSLGNDKFIRVRLGIDPLQGSGLSKLSEHNKSHFNAEHFVLEPFMPNEKSHVKQMVKKAVQALQILLDKGVEAAQNQYN